MSDDDVSAEGTGTDPPSTPTILIAGTASHVGKSTVAAGLCRHLANRGLSVAPYKAQNMSNNARAVPTATGDGWGEIGVSQYVQARASRTPATTDANPVLLKPRGDGESQVVLDGEAVGHAAATEFYDDRWQAARETAVDAHRRLAAANDLVVAEGAGAVIEPNLRNRDLANVETARFADAQIVLVADVERGGMFASVVGTLDLLPTDLRERVAGVVVTKFRGDRSLLADGVEWLENHTGVPVLGVIPYDDPGLPEEDSVSLPDTDERHVLDADDTVPESLSVTVAVPRFPRVSNATDVAPLARVPGVRVEWVPLGDFLDDADAVLLPGTKNTVDDLLACHEAGLDDALAAFDGPVVGLCGGYQMLGQRIRNADVEGTGEIETVAGFGLLPVETVFSEEKQVEAVERELSAPPDADHPLGGAAGTVAGYEIHMGESRLVDGVDPESAAGETVTRPLGANSVAVDGVLGTYLHGLFENRIARDAFVDRVFAAAGVERPTNSEPADPTARYDPYAAAAALVRDHLDLSPLDLPDPERTADGVEGEP